MTTTERLAEIKARAEAATEGPWEHVRDSNEHLADCPPTYESLVTADNGYVAVLDWGNTSTSPDAEFIAHARTDVPALVAALEAVLALHSRVFDMNNTPTCRECADDYPCPTVEAVNKALGVDRG